MPELASTARFANMAERWADGTEFVVTAFAKAISAAAASGPGDSLAQCCVVGGRNVRRYR